MAGFATMNNDKSMYSLQRNMSNKSHKFWHWMESLSTKIVQLVNLLKPGETMNN